MKKIKWYNVSGYDNYTPHEDGNWATRTDVEALQKELQEMTAKAVAAVWLIPDESSMDALRGLYTHAQNVFLGDDKKTIAKLQDEVSRLKVDLIRRAQDAQSYDNQRPGINEIYGVKRGDKAELRYALPILSIVVRPNRGLEVEVQLP